MLHISLFSGIGGFDLAAQWAGWTNIVSCEINPFGRKVLSHYWPDAYHHDDIHTLTYEVINEKLKQRFGTRWRTDDIVLTGGFPCQPYSLAGKRLGKEDERHLWPQMLRVIREVKPDWIVGENVFGLVNWSDGLVFNEVQTDLEAEGYEVQSFVLPACATDAPHRRDRLWIIAYYKSSRVQPCANGREEYIIKNRATVRYMPDANGQEWAFTNANSNGQHRSNGEHEVNASEGGQYAQRDTIEGAEYGDATNANGERQQQQSTVGELERKRPCESNIHNNRADWERFPSQSPVCPRDDGFSTGLDGITFPKWRNESIKASGNAVVPQVVYRIFETINQFNKNTP